MKTEIMQKRSFVCLEGASDWSRKKECTRFEKPGLVCVKNVDGERKKKRERERQRQRRRKREEGGGREIIIVIDQ